MKVQHNYETDLTPEAVGKALAGCTPEDFARVWLKFSQEVQNNKIDLVPFGEAMGEPFGSARLEPLFTITRIAEVHYIKHPNGGRVMRATIPPKFFASDITSADRGDLPSDD